MTRWFAFVSAALVLFSAGGAFAGAITETKFALHVKATTKKTTTICTTWSPVPPESTWGTSPPTPCANFVTSGDLLTSYYIYLVVAETDDAGISGMSCGVDYAAGLRVEWQDCETSCSPTGDPTANGLLRGAVSPDLRGIHRRIENAAVSPNGVQAVAGWFTAYAYSPNRLSITGNFPVDDPSPAATDCNSKSAVIKPIQAGWVEFSAGGMSQGCNPCTPPCFTPVRPSSWGRLKNRYAQGLRV